MKARLSWTRWAPLLLLAGVLGACGGAAVPKTAEEAAAPPVPGQPPAPAPAPAEPQATCDELAIRLLDRGPGVHGAIVADTLHLGGATAPVNCLEPANQSVAGWSIPDDWTAQAQQSQYYLIVVRYPGGNRLYIISRRGDGTSCIVDTNDECVAEVSDLADDFDLSDLPDDVAPTIPAGRPAPPTPPAPAAPPPGGGYTPPVVAPPTAPAPGAPGKAGSPHPHNGQAGVAVDAPLLQWSPAFRATRYDLYWGTAQNLAADEALGTPINTASTVVTIRMPGATAAERRLAEETTYYWRVDAMNVAGTTRGDVWSFTTAAAPVAPAAPVATTAPAVPGNPRPRNEATRVPVDRPVLRWSAAARATSYDLYWGTTQNLAADTALGTPITTTAYTPAVLIRRPGATAAERRLAEETTYYWRVDAKNAAGTTRGDVWSFTTAPVVTKYGTLWIYDESVDEGDAGDRIRTDIEGPGSRLLWVYWKDHELPDGTSTVIDVKMTGVTATRCVDFIHAGCDEVQIVGQDEGREYGANLTVRRTATRWGLDDVPLDVAGIYSSIAIIGDDIKEEDETFRIEIAPRAGGIIPTCGRCSATFTIRNDD